MDKLFEWGEIADGFQDTVVLGNGASIALDARFSYGSLLDQARVAELITPTVDAVFGYLGTKDFELVLNLLWHAVHVNRALEIDETRTSSAYEEVRRALVEAVQRNHTDYVHVQPRLAAVSGYLQRFRTVFSLNYDLIVYWAMMEANREVGNWFKDCFIGGVFDHDWERLRDPYGAEGATLVFYPHGSLILASSLHGGESKIQREDDWDDLLFRITSLWEEGDVSPLFVSEGDSSQKTTAIRRSNYLSTVFDTAMPARSESIVFYGCSLSNNDAHVLSQLAKGGPTRVAASLWTGDRSSEDVEAEFQQIHDRLLKRFPRAERYVFRADSPGAWVH